MIERGLRSLRRLKYRDSRIEAIGKPIAEGITSQSDIKSSCGWARYIIRMIFAYLQFPIAERAFASCMNPRALFGPFGDRSFSV